MHITSCFFTFHVVIKMFERQVLVSLWLLMFSSNMMLVWGPVAKSCTLINAGTFRKSPANPSARLHRIIASHSTSNDQGSVDADCDPSWSAYTRDFSKLISPFGPFIQGTRSSPFQPANWNLPFCLRIGFSVSVCTLFPFTSLCAKNRNSHVWRNHYHSSAIFDWH